MNASQVHLALTHVPVILTIVGMVALAIAVFKNNSSLKGTALVILIIAGVAVLPVFFTGEPAEEAVEHLPGVSESIIGSHEDFAKYALIAILATAGLAIAAMIRFLSPALKRSLAIIVLVLSTISTALSAQTAHLGGQIRHSEIRAGADSTAGEEEGGED